MRQYRPLHGRKIITPEKITREKGTINMKKKALSLFISAVMLSSAFAIPAAANQTDDYLSSMTTEDKISCMIMPAFRYYIDEEGDWTNATEITNDIEAALEKHSFGGVILYGQNTPTNENTTRLTDALQKANRVD